jgi:alpha-glucosidase
VANAFLHDTQLRDNPAIPDAQRGPVEWSAAANMQRHLRDSNLEENRGVLDVIRRRVDTFENRFVFGEFSEEFERSGCYLPSGQGLHAGYNFALLLASDAGAIRAHLETLAAFADHWPCIAFSNHDVIRTATRFAPQAAPVMLALLCALRGTMLLYQGEELGLPEVVLRRDQLKDPVGDLYYPLFKGRDGCRTPMPWDAAKPNLGFSSATPWLPLGSEHRALAVSEQDKDPASTLNLFRALMHQRAASAALRTGDLTLLEAPLPLIAFRRGEDTLCLFNLGPETMRWAAPAQCGAFFSQGQTSREGDVLTLGPFSVWLGTVHGP